MTEDRVRYTSSAISEIHKITENDLPHDDKKVTSFTLDWYPVASVKSIETIDENGEVTGTFTVVKENPNGAQATVTEEGVVTLGTNPALGQQFKIKYLYNNEIIPQTVQPVSLPTLTAKMQAVNLHAHARRIAINLYVA